MSPFVFDSDLIYLALILVRLYTSSEIFEQAELDIYVDVPPLSPE